MIANAVLYARVSTDEQAREGHSLAAQEELCRDFARRQGWPVAGVWRDEGLSGGLPLRRRPALRGAIESLAPASALVVLRLDRLYRADEYDRGQIDRAIRERGARVRSTQGEGTESDRSSDVMQRGILNSVALGEKLRIGERTREALGSKRGRGERLGQVPYGKRLAADGRTLEDDPARAAVRELARELHAGGLSLRKIAAELTARGYRAHRRPGRVLLGHVERLQVGEPPESIAARPKSASPPPPLEDLRRAAELVPGRTPRQVLALLEAEAAAAPPAPGETFPLSTIRLFLKESPCPEPIPA